MTISLPAVADQRHEKNRVGHKVSDSPKPTLGFRRSAAANRAGRLNILAGHRDLLSNTGIAA